MVELQNFLNAPRMLTNTHTHTPQQTRCIAIPPGTSNKIFIIKFISTDDDGFIWQENDEILSQ